MASDVFLVALDGQHVAVDYRGYRVLCMQRSNIKNMAFVPSVIIWMPWPGIHLITLVTNAMFLMLL